MNQAVRKRPTTIGNFKERKTADRPRCRQPTNRRNECALAAYTQARRRKYTSCGSAATSLLRPDSSRTRVPKGRDPVVPIVHSRPREFETNRRERVDPKNGGKNACGIFYRKR